MSHVTYHKKEGADGKRVEMIYHNEEDFRTQAEINTHGQQQHNTGYESTRKRSYRSVAVCLALLCVLLLTAVIVLCVLIYTNNHQYNKTALWMSNNKADEWIYYRSSFYYIPSNEKKNWTESRKFCRERRADLIIINNKEKQDFFRRQDKSERFWIGLSDSEKEGLWKWVDNSTPTTEFWKHGEPNGNRKEDCAITYSEWWYDYPCTHDFKWICEINFFNDKP